MNIDVENCEIVKVQKVITGKWNMIIILFLSEGVLGLVNYKESCQI